MVRPPVVTNPVVWIEKPYAALTLDELYALLAFRQEVFAVEQNCPYLDADGYDDRAWHIWTIGADGRVAAYARVFGPGVKYPEASIGRVATALALRRTGLGRALVAQSLDLVRRQFGAVAVHISAQAHLERFYGDFGFVRCTENYLEDDIPHVGMIRAARG